MNKKQQIQKNSSEQIIVSRQFSGPIPSPDAFEKYELIVQGAAERILKMAENEAESRIRNEGKLVDNEVKITNNIVRSSYLGVFFAFAAVLILSALAYLAIIKDHPEVAIAIVVAMASIAGLFILFRNRKNNK